MDGTVKIPGIGPVKKSWAIAGAAATAGIVGFAYYKHRSASSASQAASGTSAGTGTDPATGYPYGSPQDQAALAAQQTSTSASVDPETGFPYGSVQDQQALSALEGGAGSIGASGTGTATNIDPLTGDVAGSAEDVAALQALYGSTSTGTGTSGTGTSGTTTPAAAPPAAPVATSHPAPSSYSDTPYATSVDLGWGSVGDGLTYHYQVLSSSGAVVADHTTTALHVAVPGLKPSTAYKWRVSADPSGLWTPFVSFTTRKS
jgi:hypothetical protein